MRFSPSFGAAEAAGEQAQSIRRLTVVSNLPVSVQCNMHVLADGPFERREVENLVKQLQQQIELGAFDAPAQRRFE